MNKKQENGKEVKKSVRHLRCQLTDQELLQSGKELADRSAELKALETSKAQVTADFGARMKMKEAEIEILTNRMQTGYEHRPIHCEERLDNPKPGQKMVIRTDTGDTIGIENMTADEMQRELEVA